MFYTYYKNLEASKVLDKKKPVEVHQGIFKTFSRHILATSKSLSRKRNAQGEGMF